MELVRAGRGACWGAAVSAGITPLLVYAANGTVYAAHTRGDENSCAYTPASYAIPCCRRTGQMAGGAAPGFRVLQAGPPEPRRGRAKNEPDRIL